MKKAVIIVAGILLVILLILFFRFSQFYSKVYISKKNAPNLAPEKKVFNILFMGYGGANHDGPYLTDTLMLIHLDMKTNTILLISLPRDIWVKIPTISGSDFHAKINTLYEMELFPKDFPDVDTRKSTDSKTSLVSTTVEHITGLPVDYFVGVDFSGFTKIIDTLGGIDVTVAKSFTDPQYPIDGKENELCGKDEQFKLIEPYLNNGKDATPDAKAKLLKEKPELDEFLKNATETPELAFPCRYETLTFNAGLQHMTGEQALKFARSRHALQDGGDFARARRQQLVIEALKNKMLKITSIPKLFSVLDDLEKDIRTDTPIELLRKFLTEGKGAGSYKISNIVLSDNDYLDYSTSGDGQSILIPKAGVNNWAVVKMWIKTTMEHPTKTQ